jgi:hypothetical protein
MIKALKGTFPAALLRNPRVPVRESCRLGKDSGGGIEWDVQVVCRPSPRLKLRPIQPGSPQEFLESFRLLDLEVSHSFGGIAQIFSRDQLGVRVVIDDGLVLIGTRHTVNANLAALAVGEEAKIAACKRSARDHRNFVLNVSGAMGDDALLASQEAARMARECKQPGML